MKYVIPMLLLLLLLPIPVSAMEVSAPTVPASASERMSEDTSSFGSGVAQLVQKAFLALRPDITDAVKICLSLISAIIALTIVQQFSSSAKFAAELAGTVCIAGTLLMNTNAIIHLGASTVTELTEYGKLLCPVMTTALAAQGGLTSSAGLYAGTMAFISVITSLLSKVLLPMVYVFLALATASCALGEAFLSRIKAMVKQGISWSLKTLITIFTSYLSITGVVAGTTDAAALKAARVTISSFVPVVGGILSDASESVLVSASIAKNAAGVYGLLAIMAVFLQPFLKIGLHYLMLKIAAAICELIGSKNTTTLMDDFSSAMGLILGMTGSVCLLLLISTICFMKGTA